MSRHGGRSIAEEVDEGRCVGCGLLCDGGYFCHGCAFGSTFVRRAHTAHHERWSSATSVGRAQRIRVDRAAEIEQFRYLQGTHDPRVSKFRVGLSGEDYRNMRIACAKFMPPVRWGFDSTSGIVRARERKERQR